MTDPTIVQEFTIQPTGGPPSAARRPLHVFFVCDTSQSMEIGGRIQALNAAMESGIQVMQQAQDDPAARGEILVRALQFGSQVDWAIMAPTPVKSVRWQPLSTSGLTMMGRALSMVADELHSPPMESHAFAPVVILITDGEPTDDFEGGLAALNAAPWGKVAIRIAIAVDSSVDRGKLDRFCFSHPKANTEANRVLYATDVAQITDAINWVSVMVSSVAQKGKFDATASQPSVADSANKNPAWS